MERDGGGKKAASNNNNNVDQFDTHPRESKNKRKATRRNNEKADNHEKGIPSTKDVNTKKERDRMLQGISGVRNASEDQM